MKRRGKQIGITIVCAALALAAVPWLIVRVLAVEVEFDEIGIRVESVPEEARALFWSRIGGEGEPRLPEGSSLGLLWSGYEAFAVPGPALRLAILASIEHVPSSTGAFPRLWRLRFVASTIRLSRHWTATEALTAVLQRAHYGHGFRGLEAAAIGYFGHSSARLTRAELASLVVTANFVQKFNPWCRRSENAEAVSRLLARAETATAESADPLARLRPVPEGVCPKR